MLPFIYKNGGKKRFVIFPLLITQLYNTTNVNRASRNNTEAMIYLSVTSYQFKSCHARDRFRHQSPSLRSLYTRLLWTHMHGDVIMQVDGCWVMTHPRDWRHKRRDIAIGHGIGGYCSGSCWPVHLCSCVSRCLNLCGFQLILTYASLHTEINLD